MTVSTLATQLLPESEFMRTLRLDRPDVPAMREAVRQYFTLSFDRYESLFETLASPEAFYQKSIPLRHPLIFYFGHTATFFVNKLLLAGLLSERINPRFESMFAVGVDEMSWDDLNDAHYDWPSIEEVKAYRQAVRKAVNQVITQSPLTFPIDWQNPWWAILMGIEHEQIHLETSSVLIRQQRLEWIRPHPDWRPWTISRTAPVNRLLPVAGGQVRLGQAHDAPYYGWDNEYGQHQSTLEPFTASQYLVSNQEFLEFVEADGYGTEAFWSEQGLRWRQFTQAKHPTFWVQTAHGWQLRLMTECVAMPWDWPVEVNYHEAKAFCAWKSQQIGQSVRLPSEDEWVRLYEVAGVKPLDARAAPGNLHLDYAASSCPVTQFQHGAFFDVVGNVWQWTETPIYPFDGFKVHPIYDDFTTPTYDGQHHLIKGGSWISCGNETRPTARYAFRPHFFQHAGFRYVCSTNPTAPVSSPYERDPEVAQAAEFQYGEPALGTENFSKALVACVMEKMQGKSVHRALDLGCTVGRSACELAKHCESVTAVDFSARMIQIGVQMAEQGVIRYAVIDEGELLHYRESTVQALGLEGLGQRIEFVQGDPCNLKASLTGYDLVVAAHLLEKLYDPSRFLAQIAARMQPGGVLVLASSYAWDAAITERQLWVGGCKQDGESLTSLEALKSLLSPAFSLMGAPQTLPRVMRKTARVYDYQLSEVTFWQRQADDRIEWI